MPAMPASSQAGKKSAEPTWGLVAEPRECDQKRPRCTRKPTNQAKDRSRGRIARSGREARISWYQLLFSVVDFSRGTLPTKKGERRALLGDQDCIRIRDNRRTPLTHPHILVLLEDSGRQAGQRPYLEAPGHICHQVQRATHHHLWLDLGSQAVPHLWGAFFSPSEHQLGHCGLA